MLASVDASGGCEVESPCLSSAELDHLGVKYNAPDAWFDDEEDDDPFPVIVEKNLSDGVAVKEGSDTRDDESPLRASE